jgi:drug/metabolite transporter (DMT)-like permease
MENFLTLTAVLLRIISNPFGNVFQKKLISAGRHPLFINFLSYALLIIPCGFIAAPVYLPQLPLQFWVNSLLAGIFGGVGNGLLIKALEKGDLSVLGPVNSYKSVIGALAALIILREAPNIWGLTGIGLIIWGSYFVLNTTDDKFSLKLLKRKEIQYRIGAMVLTAIEAVFVKNMVLSSTIAVASLSWCVFGAVVSLLMLLLFRVNVRNELTRVASGEIIMFAFLLTCVGVMLFTTIYTFDHMPVGYALSLFQLSTIGSVLLGRQFFNEKNIREKLLGAAIMVVGSVFIILFK